MSDTPLTDAEWAKGGHLGGYKFARKLELELAEKDKQILAMRNCSNCIRAYDMARYDNGAHLNCKCQKCNHYFGQMNPDKCQDNWEIAK